MKAWNGSRWLWWALTAAQEFSIEIPDKEADAIHSGMFKLPCKLHVGEVLTSATVSQAVDYIMHQPDGKPSTRYSRTRAARILTFYSPLNAGCVWEKDKKSSVGRLRKRRVTSRLGVECVYASPARGRLIHLYSISSILGFLPTSRDCHRVLMLSRF